MKFGSDESACSCRVRGFGGFVKLFLLIIYPLGLIYCLAVVVFPLNAWLENFTTLRHIPRNISFTPGFTFSIREQKALREEMSRRLEYNMSIFHFENLQTFDSEEKNEEFYKLVPFLVQSRSILISLFSILGFVLFFGLIGTVMEWRGVSIFVSVLNLLCLVVYLMLLFSSFGTSFDIFSTIFSFQLQHHNYQNANISAENAIFREMERNYNCCGVAGPADYSKKSGLLELFVGKLAVPAWINSHDFQIYQDIVSTPSPLDLNPITTVIPTIQSSNDVDVDGSVIRIRPDGTGGESVVTCEGSCDGLTININDPAPQPTSPPTTKVVYVTPTKKTRQPRTRPWPYTGMIGEKWPWYMGPKPKGQECDRPDGMCVPRDMDLIAGRKRRAVPDNLRVYNNIKFIVPDERIEFANFSVPDSCCVKKSQFCGLKNTFSYKLPKFSNPPDINRLYPGLPNDTLGNMSTSESVNDHDEEKNSSENIHINGCYKKFQFSEILSFTELKSYFTYPLILLLIISVFQILFSVSLCIKPSGNLGPPKVEKSRRSGLNRRNQNFSHGYGRHPVPVSQVL